MIALLRRVLCRLGKCRGARSIDYEEAARISAEKRAYIDTQYRMMNDLRRRQ